jgi:hypothetical protein
MRTKVLICAAALAAVSAFTTMAQNVYSLNVVGYINIPLVEGFQLVANQLDFDGTGLNNTPANVLGASLPTGSSVFTWNGTAYSESSYAAPKGGGAATWNNAISLNPGQGAWLSIPSKGLSGTLSNLTVVGQVDQGTLVNTNLAKGGGFSLLSSMVPLTGGLQTALSYTPLVGDKVFQWNPTTQAYLPASSFATPKGGGAAAWTPSEPQIGVGASGVSEGFWLSSGAAAGWTNVFSVQ